MRCQPRNRRAGFAAVLVLAAGVVGPVSEAPGGEPSAEYKASLQKTLELRRGRRREARPPVGAIVTYPMPPVLIIRHTRETHDEIGAFLDLLRYGGR
jgi:hypothetical protein